MKKINFLSILLLVLYASSLFAHAGTDIYEFETKEDAMTEEQKIKTRQYGIDYLCRNSLSKQAVKFVKSPLLGLEIEAFTKEFKCVQRLVKRNKYDTDKKPDSFWTTVVLGLSFTALMLILKAPIAMLFFFVISGIGLGGYYIFRRKNKRVAEAFLMFATALNLGLGVIALYGIWLGSVVD